MKHIVLTADSPSAQTQAGHTALLQAALDEIFIAGGGVLELSAGCYQIGSVRIRSNTTLLLRSGVEIIGSRDPEDYCVLQNDTLEPLPEEWQTDKTWESFVKGRQRCYDFMLKPGGRWGNAMIRAVGAQNVAIIGEEGAVLDGRDCFDAVGEEDYRGPHGISMHYCTNVTLRGYTIRNTGNWAHCIFGTDNIVMEHVTALAGHDGVHCTSCKNIRVTDCEFYTGDDCIAGFANLNLYAARCVCNTACSGMRLGGTNALIRDCRFYGPARHFFRGSLSPEEKRSGAQAHRPHRVNMLSVLTYYADYSVEIPEQPGNIVITDCTVDNVDRFLHYNYSGNERWQSHRPLANARFENITATNVHMPLTAYGSAEQGIDLVMKNVSVAFAEDAKDIPFLQTAYYDRIVLDHVTVTKEGHAPLIKRWTEDGTLVFKDVRCPLPESEWVRNADEPFVCTSI